jgi:hypothetical protein
MKISSPIEDHCQLDKVQCVVCVNLLDSKNAICQCSSLIEDDVRNTTSDFQLLWISKDDARTGSDTAGNEHYHWYCEANCTWARDNKCSYSISEGIDCSRASAAMKVVPK